MQQYQCEGLQVLTTEMVDHIWPNFDQNSCRGTRNPRNMLIRSWVYTSNFSWKIAHLMIHDTWHWDNAIETLVSFTDEGIQDPKVIRKIHGHDI